MKRIVITGVTGFIGHALAERLLKQGIEVYGVGRSENKFSELEKYSGFHKIILDFEQYSKLHNILKGIEIDCFFHAAHRGVNGSKKNDYKVQLQNLEVACETVVQASLIGCNRYIYVGSVDEYEASNMPDSGFITPTHSRIYGATKFSSEIIGKVIAYENNIEYVSTLLSLTYGEGNSTNILPNVLIRNCQKGISTNLIKGNNYFDAIYIEEALDGIIAIAENGRPYESYFIGHEKLRTFKEIVLDISDAIGYAGDLNFGSYPDPSFSLDFSLIDRGKLFRDTNIKCEYDFKESILKTKQWIINTGKQ